MTVIQIGLAAAVALGVCGCAEQKAFEKLSNLTAQSAVEFKGEEARYVDAANGLRRTAADNKQTLQDLTDKRTYEAAQTRQSWKVGADSASKAALQAYDAATAIGRDPNLSPPLTPLFGRASPPVTVLKFEPATYDALVEQLTALGKPKSVKEEAQFVEGWVKQADDAYQADMKKATTVTAKATVAGGAAAEGTATAVKATP